MQIIIMQILQNYTTQGFVASQFRRLSAIHKQLNKRNQK